MAAFTELRNSLLSQLSVTAESVPGDAGFYQGRLVRERLSVPQVTWGSTATPSPEHHPDLTPSWLTASEFSDPESSLAVKVSVLQDLLVSSRETLVFVGAGAATSAGLRQWARGAGGSRADYRTTEAAPSVTHLTLASLVQVSPPSLPHSGINRRFWWTFRLLVVSLNVPKKCKKKM